MPDITSLSILELKEHLSSGKLTSVEVTKSYLERIQKFKGLNAFLECNLDRAIFQAEEADKKIANKEQGKLLGIPLAVKDNINVNGTKTSCASKILSNFISPYNATVIDNIKREGGIIIGKTNMDEFAMGSSTENSFYGPSKNPWNPEYVPGGSSGGSAAAVSADLAPAALGTDTGGSVRQPSAFCNLVGIKPTYGRVSRYGIVAYASSLDQVGSFGKNVRDCALLTEVISGFDPKDSTSVNRSDTKFSAKIGQDIKGLRIGVPKEYFIDGLDPVVKDKVQDSLRLLSSLGAIIVDVSLPHTEAAIATYYIIAPAEASSNLARYDGIRYGFRAEKSSGLQDLYCTTRSEGFGDEVKRRIIIGNYVLSSGYYDAYYLRAQKVRTLIINDFKEVFSNQCDVILSPTTPSGPFKIDSETHGDPLTMYLNDVFTVPVNLAGLPGISIPCGFDANNLPIGVQLIGKPWDESTLFQVAAAHEAETSWHTMSPKMFQEGKV